MSDRLAAAAAFSFRTDETHTRVGPSGEPSHRTLAREVVVRRPDGVWFGFSGDRTGALWYDGKAVTLRSDPEKVWGRFGAPPTLDETLDMMAARYAIPMPMADLLYSAPYDALFTADTEGGWVGTDEIAGVSCEHLAFRSSTVDWELWIGRAAPRMPCRLTLVYKNEPGPPSSTITFRDWNLASQAAPGRFAAVVPEDYERIGIVALLEGEAAPGPAADAATTPAAASSDGASGTGR